MSNWIVFIIIILLILVVLYTLFRIVCKGRKQKKMMLPNEGRVEPTVDTDVKPQVDVAGFNKEPDDVLLKEEIQKAGEEAVASSYGEAHQSEITFGAESTDPSDWNKVVKESYERRVGKAPLAAKMQDKPKQSKISHNVNDVFIMIYLMAPRSSQYDGQDVLRALRRQGLKLTDNHVFEFKKFREGTLYYVGSATPSGTFDMEKIHQFTVTGLNFIIDLEKCVDPKRAMNDMLNAIDNIVKLLGGDILDDRRQRINHASLSEYYARIKSEEMLRKASHG